MGSIEYCIGTIGVVQPELLEVSMQVRESMQQEERS